MYPRLSPHAVSESQKLNNDAPDSRNCSFTTCPPTALKGTDLAGCCS